MMPSCSPLEPRITRTSRARIRPFTRNCCCRLNQSPGRRRRECAATSYFSSSQSPASTWGIGLNTLRRRSCDDCDNGPAIFREPKGSCRQDFDAGKVNLHELNFSSAGWRAEMGGMCCVSVRIIQHRIERSRKWRNSGKSRKDRPISNFGIEHERGPLRHLQQMKISSIGADARFNHGRTRPFDQFFCIETASFRSNLRGNLPLGESFSLAQAGIGKRKPHAIVGDSKIFCGFSDAVWREIFRLLVVAPLAAQHERRAHDCAAAPVKPFVLLLRCGKTRLIHQCDLPLKFNLVMIASFQFRPRRLRPKTPRRDDVEIVSDRNSHNLKSRLDAQLFTSNVKVQTFLCARSESHFSLPRGDFTASGAGTRLAPGRSLPSLADCSARCSRRYRSSVVFFRAAVGYIGGAAWFALLFIPAIGSRKMTELAARQNYKSARKLGAALQILHPSAELREQVQLFRRLEFHQNDRAVFASPPVEREIAGKDRPALRPTGSRLDQSAGSPSSFYPSPRSDQLASAEGAARLRRVRRHRRFRNAPAVLGLILLNTAAFIFEISFGSWTDPELLHHLGALEPYAVVVQGQYWRLFTALFLHAGFVHLLFI